MTVQSTGSSQGTGNVHHGHHGKHHKKPADGQPGATQPLNVNLDGSPKT